MQYEYTYNYNNGYPLCLDIVDNNLNLGLAGELSEIYAWVIDFFGIQVGDGFKVYYDENFVDSTSVGISKIHAAVFTHNKQQYYAYNFEKDETNGFWDEKGNSFALNAETQF